MEYQNAALAILDKYWNPETGEYLSKDELIKLLREQFDTVYDVTVVLNCLEQIGGEPYSIIEVYCFIDSDEATAFQKAIEAGDHAFALQPGETIETYFSSRKMFPEHETEFTERNPHDKK
jgi:hypothetical protein